MNTLRHINNYINKTIPIPMWYIIKKRSIIIQLPTKISQAPCPLSSSPMMPSNSHGCSV